jgi:hypothetical protein
MSLSASYFESSEIQVFSKSASLMQEDLVKHFCITTITRSREKKETGEGCIEVIWMERMHQRTQTTTRKENLSSTAASERI